MGSDGHGSRWLGAAEAAGGGDGEGGRPCLSPQGRFQRGRLLTGVAPRPFAPSLRFDFSPSSPIFIPFPGSSNGGELSLIMVKYEPSASFRPSLSPVLCLPCFSIFRH